jgi:GntR family transcriptional regulator
LIKDFENDTAAAAGKTVDKRAKLPAYAQLANILKSSISQGQYPPGAQLPAEAALARMHGVSTMTARQAVSVLEEQGLVSRAQGKGTYVRKIGVAACSFSLDAMTDTLADKDNLTVRILKAAIKKTPGMERQVLELAPDQPVVVVERLILHRNEPFTLQVSYSNFDPASPTVESMLDTVVLTELIFQEGCSNIKRGVLHLLPTRLGRREAELLELEKGATAFKLEHLYYDFDNRPAAFGWFIVSHEKIPIVSKIGIWDE